MNILHDNQIIFCTQMAHLGVQQMQVIFQRLNTYLAVLRREIFSGSTVTAVQLIDIINKLNNLILRQILVQPAAKLRRKIILAVRKGSGTAKAAHNAARIAIDAVVNLLRRQWAEALFNRIAGLQHHNLQLRIFQHKLIGRKNCCWATANNRYIVHKNSPLKSSLRNKHVVARKNRSSVINCGYIRICISHSAVS